MKARTTKYQKRSHLDILKSESFLLYVIIRFLHQHPPQVRISGRDFRSHIEHDAATSIKLMIRLGENLMCLQFLLG
eukprot:12927546-Prorocentrum_lima.AAC.1